MINGRHFLKQLVLFGVLALFGTVATTPISLASEQGEPVRVLTFNILASEPSWETNARSQPWAIRKPR